MREARGAPYSRESGKLSILENLVYLLSQCLVDLAANNLTFGEVVGDFRKKYPVD